MKRCAHRSTGLLVHLVHPDQPVRPVTQVHLALISDCLYEVALADIGKGFGLPIISSKSSNPLSPRDACVAAAEQAGIVFGLDIPYSFFQISRSEDQWVVHARVAKFRRQIVQSGQNGQNKAHGPDPQPFVRVISVDQLFDLERRQRTLLAPNTSGLIGLALSRMAYLGRDLTFDQPPLGQAAFSCESLVHNEIDGTGIDRSMRNEILQMPNRHIPSTIVRLSAVRPA